MDALIMCGGYATRLGDIAYFTPKQLLPLSGRPVIDYILESMAALEVQRVIISTNKKFADQFEYWLKLKRAAGYSKPIELIIEETKSNEEKLGAVKGLQYAIGKAKVERDLIVIAGDNFYNFALAKVIEEFKKHGKATIALYDVKSVEEAKKFGVVTMEGEKIKNFEEKPKEPKSTLVSTGIYVFPKEALVNLENYVKSDQNVDNLGGFVRWMVENSEVCGTVCAGEWFDIGTVDTYRNIFDSYLDRRLL